MDQAPPQAYTVEPLKENFVLRPADPEERRDKVRAFTTGAFIILFGLTVLCSFAIVVFDGMVWTNVKDLLQIMLPTETALIGSVVGFYFGSRSTTSDKS